MAALKFLNIERCHESYRLDISDLARSYWFLLGRIRGRITTVRTACIGHHQYSLRTSTHEFQFMASVYLFIYLINKSCDKDRQMIVVSTLLASYSRIVYCRIHISNISKFVGIVVLTQPYKLLSSKIQSKILLGELVVLCFY